jgi:magnesium chelatase family protein
MEVPTVPYKDLLKRAPAESSARIRKRVAAARKRQQKRFARSKIFCNAQMSNRQLKAYCQLDHASDRLLETAIDKIGLSARAYSRIIKIARTIADLVPTDQITADHISEAIQYRSLDRKNISM